jgi:hypothetical protein
MYDCTILWRDACISQGSDISYKKLFTNSIFSGAIKSYGKTVGK